MTARDRALELLTRIVTENEGADPGCTARECLVALEGLGYRPTEARPAADWRHQGGGTGPSEEFLAAKRELAERLARRDPQDAA